MMVPILDIVPTGRIRYRSYGVYRPYRGGYGGYGYGRSGDGSYPYGGYGYRGYGYGRYGYGGYGYQLLGQSTLSKYRPKYVNGTKYVIAESLTEGLIIPGKSI